MLFDSGFFKLGRKDVSAVGDKRKRPVTGQSIDLGNAVTLRGLVPSRASEESNLFSGGDENLKTIVLLLKYKRFVLYLGGDANDKIESFLGRLVGDLDDYIAGHHGSETSSTEYFLREIKPEISIISVDDRNIYGHPSSDTVSRLKSFSSKVFQTEKGSLSSIANSNEIAIGTIIIMTDGFSYEISGSDLRSFTKQTDRREEN